MSLYYNESSSKSQTDFIPIRALPLTSAFLRRSSRAHRDSTISDTYQMVNKHQLLLFQCPGHYVPGKYKFYVLLVFSRKNNYLKEIAVPGPLSMHIY